MRGKLCNLNRPGQDRLKHGIGDGLLRRSIGPESLEDIPDDLTAALDSP